MAKYECNKFEDISGCFQQLQTCMDTQVGEVKLRAYVFAVQATINFFEVAEMLAGFSKFS